MLLQALMSVRRGRQKLTSPMEIKSTEARQGTISDAMSGILLLSWCRQLPQDSLSLCHIGLVLVDSLSYTGFSMASWMRLYACCLRHLIVENTAILWQKLIGTYSWIPIYMQVSQLREWFCIWCGKSLEQIHRRRKWEIRWHWFWKGEI